MSLAVETHSPAHTFVFSTNRGYYATDPVHRTPLEIWRLILKATIEPTELNPDPLDAHIRPNVVRAKSIRERQTSRNLVRVCHAWNHLAPEILYRRVMLFSIRAIETFCDAITSHTGRTSPGWWTRHVHVCLAEWERSQSPYEYDCQLKRLLSLLPKLHTFTADGPSFAFGNEPPFLSTTAAVAKQIGTLSSASLTRIDWDGSARVEYRVFLALCVMCPNLESMTVAFADIERPRIYPLSGLVSFLHLRHLHARFVTPWLLRELITWFLPSLQHLILSSILPDDISILLPFFHQHGAQLLTFELRGSVPGVRPGPLLDLCPNLQDFIISPLGTIALTTASPHPSLRRIGLDSILPRAGITQPDEVELLKRHFSNLTKEMFPKLFCVRIMDGYGLDLLARQEWWNAFVKVWVDRDIRFEDQHGLPITSSAS